MVVGSRTRLVLLAAVLLAPRGVAAQGDGYLPVDRVVAVVGEKPITLSRLEEEWNLAVVEMQRTGRPLPKTRDDTVAVRHELLQRLIDDELLVQQALRDTTVKVTDQQVQSAVEGALRQTRAQFASEFEFRRELQRAGLGTPEEYRRMLTDQVRRRLLTQELVQQRSQRGDMRSIPPTEAEIRKFWETTRDQQPRRPASVTFRQLVIRPKPTAAAEAGARALADSVLLELRAGADFETAARRFSGDPGTKELGGDLGWFRRGRMVPAFEDAAFRLRPGQISNVVRTPFGFHLIQVERIEPTEIKARHILFAPVLTDDDRAAARAVADSVADALTSGAPFDSLQRAHHDPLDQSLFDAVAETDLPATVRTALTASQPGDIVGPIELNDGMRTGFAVIRFDDRRPEGEYTYEELRDRLRSRLMEDSGIRRFVEDLRKLIYIDIRM